MNELDIESFDGVRIRAYHTPAAPGRDNLVIALPLATKPSFIQRVVASLSRHFNIITWEARLLLTPQAPLADKQALSTEAHVRDLNILLDHLGIQRTSLLGYCSGAAMALRIAAMDEGRLDKLVLINGAYFLKPEGCEVTQYERDILALAPQLAASRAQSSYIFSRFFEGNPSFRKRELEFADEIYRPYDHAESFFRFGVSLDQFIRSDSRRVAREIKLPTLVASGGLDDQTHPASSTLIASDISAKAIYFDKVGDHYAFCRAKKETIERVMEFLGTGT
ncbi:alpha/beta hydrolase [Archangium minus]|uniref:Alpha/beta hydrolase n=1 Tax=Archangium minus TaxID=83450 RepID=A0ABY9WID4_9BACT|nr:alpha/beta hydrolase [Archangium minus]